MKKKLPYLLFVRIPFWMVVISILLVTAFRWIPVRNTPLMLKRSLQHKETRIQRKWVPLEEVSPDLIQAVIAAEDNRFAQHNGFDTTEIRKMFHQHAKHGKKLRGCSTISQQTAKNVFLWPASSWIRKGFETYFTFLIELMWSKERIMEVYLNTIEMGDGIYGAQAVAEHHFGTTASGLTKKQCALIAASLPNPLRYNSAKPSAYLLKRQRQIIRQMPYIENQKKKYNFNSN